MNESSLSGHHYEDGDYKFVLNFWVDDLEKEYNRLQNLNIGKMTDIIRVHEGYYYFHIYDEDKNVVEITGKYHDQKTGGFKMNLICQSCGMTMTDADHGKNADDSINHDYCKYCFNNGHFGKDETMEEMIEGCSRMRQ